MYSIVKLKNAMRKARQDLAGYREKRFEAVKQYVGKNYGGDGSEKRIPVNMLNVAVAIYVRELVARNPGVSCTTRYLGLRPMANKLSMAMNHLLREIQFEDSLRRVALDAMFGVGIMKVGLSRDQARGVEIDGFWHDIGQPFADAIDLDDWVHDTTANRWDQIKFCGSRHRMPIEYAKNCPFFENTDQLMPLTRRDVDDDGYERVESIGRGGRTLSSGSEFQDECEVWDIWLPQEGIIITMPDTGDKPLYVADWEGPESGPYHILGFEDVPGSIMPLPPVSTLLDLNDTVNALYRKMRSQAVSQKTIIGVPPGAAGDAERIKGATDLEMIKLDGGVGALQQQKYGGIDQSSLAFAMHVLDKLSYLGGNLDTLAGLSIGATTLGQEQLLSSSASKKMAGMQSRMFKFTSEVVKDLAWYLWYDPLIEIPLVYRVENTDIDVPMKFTAEDKEGDFLDYNIEIVPYSMQQKSPSEQLQTLSMVFQQFIAPFVGTPMMAGAQVNIQGLLKTVSELTGMKYLDDIIQFTGPVDPMDQQPVGTPPAKFSRTVNTRISEQSGRPRGGPDQQVQSMMNSASRMDQAQMQPAMAGGGGM
jgi:hypothetical protein